MAYTMGCSIRDLCCNKSPINPAMASSRSPVTVNVEDGEVNDNSVKDEQHIIDKLGVTVGFELNEI